MRQIWEDTLAAEGFVSFTQTSDFRFLFLDLHRISPLDAPKVSKSMEGAIHNVFSPKILFSKMWKVGKMNTDNSAFLEISKMCALQAEDHDLAWGIPNHSESAIY